MEFLALALLIPIILIGGSVSLLFHAGKKILLYGLALFGLVSLINPGLANEMKQKAAEKIKEKIRNF